jgi:hypothetical protein
MGGVMTQSQYGEWETHGDAIDSAVFNVASIHHIHGTACLCGYTSARARSRTEHIINETLKALTPLLPHH